MHKGVLSFAIAAALAVGAIDKPSAMAASALNPVVSANSGIEPAGYYLWGTYTPPDANSSYYRLGDNGYYQPRRAFFSAYQTYGCSYFPDEYCIYRHWPPFFFPGFQ